MNITKVAIDPLWQCLCPSWTAVGATRAVGSATRIAPSAMRCLHTQGTQRRVQNSSTDRRVDIIFNPLQQADKPWRPNDSDRKPRPPDLSPSPPDRQTLEHASASNESLYTSMASEAIDGNVMACRQLAEMLVRERGQRPNLRIYNALILSNIGHEGGAAWRAGELMDEMKGSGLQPDAATCHAMLKVLSVHPDHLLRADVLDHMAKRWYQLSDDGAHDVVAGLLREGLLEQGLEKLNAMQRDGVRVEGWLLDIAVYVLCNADEIDEACRIMRSRFDAGDQHLSRSLWWTLLDKASGLRHHEATQLVWASQVNQGYLNPPSGTCLNVLSTAALAGDAVLATEVFTHLGKRKARLGPIHYELLIDTYLSPAGTPDLARALSILSVMAQEKMDPSSASTRTLYEYLVQSSDRLSEALDILRDLHSQGRRIPLGALNLLIECYVVRRDLASALALYKQIHTFVPIAEGAKKNFADTETFNMLLRGCRRADPPDANAASFLVTELLALRVKPNALTYDRLILVFTMAHQLQPDPKSPEAKALIDIAYRHFRDMRLLDWAPRLGTANLLGRNLARSADPHCWDVLQELEDRAPQQKRWATARDNLRQDIERIWAGEDGGGDEEERGRGAMEAGEQADAADADADASEDGDGIAHPRALGRM